MLNIRDLIIDDEVAVNSLGSLIKKERIKKGLEAIQLANMVGVHRETIYLLERDVKAPRFNHLKKIEEILDVDISKHDKRYRFTKNARNNLKITRENLGMTRQQFADYINISLDTTRKWEYGTRNISNENFKLLEEKLGSNFHIG